MKMTFTGATSGIGLKLKQARQSLGLSTRAVADKLSRLFSVSHATIANYERGLTTPNTAILAALAELYGRPINWFLESGPVLTGIRYRNQPSKFRVSDRHRYEADAVRWLEGYLRIEGCVGKPLRARKELPGRPTAVKPRAFAAAIRKALGVGENEPIPSVVDAMEAFGIRVLELPTSVGIDGFAAMLGDQPAVVLNSARPYDRQRLNGAHELFHHLLAHCEPATMGAGIGENTKADEDLAFACARHFLLPKAMLDEAFEFESFVKLVKTKELFGISLSAMIYAARQEGNLTDTKARRLWIELSKRGWRVHEPGTVRADRATRFEQLVDEAITGGSLTWLGAAQLVGVREDELRKRVNLAIGIHEEQEAPRSAEPEGGEPDMHGLRLAR